MPLLLCSVIKIECGDDDVHIQIQWNVEMMTYTNSVDTRYL